MKIFIDSARLSEIEEAYSYGVLNGVTTNPSLIKKAASDAKGGMKEYITKLLKAAKGTPVSLEVTEADYEGIVRQARKIHKMFSPVSKNVFVKVPVNPCFDGKGNEADGIKAIKTLSKEKIPVNCTLIFTPEQAMLAAKAGARYVSPFAGRVDDYIRSVNGVEFEKTDYFPAYGWAEKGRMLEDNGVISGVDLVKQCVEILEKHNLKSEVIAASIRNSRQAREVALVGAHIATLPLPVIKNLLKHFKTEEGMKKFTADVVPEYADMIK